MLERVVAYYQEALLEGVAAAELSAEYVASPPRDAAVTRRATLTLRHGSTRARARPLFATRTARSGGRRHARTAHRARRLRDVLEHARDEWRRGRSFVTLNA